MPDEFTELVPLRIIRPADADEPQTDLAHLSRIKLRLQGDDHKCDARDHEFDRCFTTGFISANQALLLFHVPDWRRFGAAFFCI